MIPAPIHILLVEDNPGDARMLREILRDDVADPFELIWVESLAAAVAGLADERIELILLDLSLPDATGLETLTRMQQAAQDVPIIVLTGQSDASLGLDALRAGAQDYLLKQNLDSHLLSRVLHNAVDYKRASQVQQDSEERFRALVQHLTDVITILAVDGTVLYESPSLEKVMGYQPEAVQGLKITEVIHPDDLPIFVEGMATLLAQPALPFSADIRVRHADGSWRILETTMTNLLDQPAIHGIVVNSRDITERQRGEAALKQSETLLRAVLAVLPIGVVITDAAGQITHLNPASQQIWAGAKYLGIEQYEEYKAWWLDSGKRVEAHEWGAARAIASGEISLNEELEIERFDGVHRYMLNSALPILDRDGDLTAVVVVNQDITERKLAERALRQYNQRLELLHSIDRSILSAEPPQQIAVMVAQALTELLHCDAVRILTLDAEDNVEPYLADDPPASPASQTLLQQAIKTYGLPDRFRQGEALRIDDVQTSSDEWTGFEAILTAYGARAWILVPLLAAEQLIGILALGSGQPHAFSEEHFEIAREVADQLAIALHKSQLNAQIQEHTDLLEARVNERTEQLRAANKRSEAILMNASDATIVARHESSIEQVNSAFSALFGYSLEQGRTLSLFALVDAASTEQVGALLGQLGVGDPAERMELVGVRQDGTQFDADAAFTRVADQQTTILICNIRDITVRKAQERQLRYAASLQENVTDAVIATDLNFRIQSWNPAAEQIYGWTAAEVLGRPVDDILVTEFRSAASREQVLQDFLEKGFWTDEVVQYHKDGRALNLLSSTVLFKDERGQPFGIVAVNHDISKRIKAETELRQAWAKEKQLNALKSSFVSMVAHDFRTPLASIQSSSDLLHNYSQRMTDDKKAKHFATIQLQIKHLTDLLEDTLTLTKAESVGMDFHPVATDLELFCQALIDEMQALAGTRILQLVVEGTGDWVSLDPQLLRRALVNLLTNAIKYSPDGSAIILRVAHEAEQLVLSIQDQGIGIPAEAQAHLFEVFHRARNVGDIPGTGLGLAIVKLAVEAHGGTITVESQVGVGSTFTISLPLVATEAEAP